MDESAPIVGLPSKDIQNEFTKLGISENTVTPFRFYQLLKDIPADKRGGFKMLFSCTGGQKRSKIFADIAVEMGFDTANISIDKSKGYHKKNAVPIDELVTPSQDATFPGGNIQFSNFIDKPVNYIVVFTNDIINPKTGAIEVNDTFTKRMLNAVSLGLLQSSERTKTKPQGVTLVRVPTIEREAEQIERLFQSEDKV